VLAEAQAPFIKDRLDALGIRTVVVPDRSLADAFTAIDIVGRATGNEREAEALAARVRAQIEEVRARTRELPRRRVLCVVDRVPGTLRDLYTATKGSFIAELIEAAGGESIAPPVESGWGKISKEAVVALDPEIIIDMVQSAQGKLGEEPQAVWRELPRVRAVRDGRIYPLREMYVLHPSQFVGDTARRFAEMIHPEAFAGETKDASGTNDAGAAKDAGQTTDTGETTTKKP
jgi:iron complex transport system substrate-binding protein